MPLFKMRHATIQIHLLRHATIQIHQMRRPHYSKLSQMRHSFKKLLGLSHPLFGEFQRRLVEQIEEHCEEPYCREWGKLGAAGAARGARLHWQAGVRARARPVSRARARPRPVSTRSSRRSATRPCSGSLLPGELAASHPAEPGPPPRKYLCRLVRHKNAWRMHYEALAEAHSKVAPHEFSDPGLTSDETPFNTWRHHMVMDGNAG